MKALNQQLDNVIDTEFDNEFVFVKFPP